MARTIAATTVLAVALAACSPGSPRPGSADAPDAAAPAAANGAASLPTVTVYKSPTCGCCASWVDHLRAYGFPTETVETDDVQAVKAEHGVPAALQSCHTAVVDGYVVEGHVPAADVARLLSEAPEATGLAVPGMPVGSPGMEQGDAVQPYDVLLVADGQTSVFAGHGR